MRIIRPNDVKRAYRAPKRVNQAVTPPSGVRLGSSSLLGVGKGTMGLGSSRRQRISRYLEQ